MYEPRQVMRGIVTWGMAAAVVTMLGALPALADASLTVGPIKQVLLQGQPAYVLVANNGTINERVEASSQAALSINPTYFRLKPGQQRTITVWKSGVITATTATVSFLVVPTQATGTGVQVQGQVSTEFVVHPAQLAPTATPSPTASGNVAQRMPYWPMLIFGLVFAAYLIRRRSQKREAKRQVAPWAW